MELRHRSDRRPGRHRFVCVVVATLGATTARADVLDDLGRKLGTWEGEAQRLGQGIQRPAPPQAPKDRLQGRLIDAQVAFKVGRYEDAALMLYDVVGSGKNSPDYDVALYYLAESLFQRGDRVAARTYFTQLIAEVGSPSKYFQPALERLIELSLLLRDPTGVDDWLAALDRIPADKRRDSVPYVRGKYAFALDRYDDAMRFFNEVPQASAYSFQAQYYIGVIHVAQKDLGKATETFAALIERQPKSATDRRVIELGQLAIGRLYYEREQPSRAIDSYLLIDRKSDLFDDALYEVAWVYVKGKQFDKALRALELLALTDPSSAKLPTVKILEGNLRIRKAQMIRAQTLMGTGQNKDRPEDEYRKAETAFTETHDTYLAPHDELGKIIASEQDPQVFLAQITGRSSKTFDVASTMPELAAAWIRQEPDVERVIVIEDDLDYIQNNITQAEQTIERLESALSSPARVNIYPALATRRNRASELHEELTRTRLRLTDEQAGMARRVAQGDEVAELDRLRATRQDVVAQLDAEPDADVNYTQRLERARTAFDALDQQASEIQVVVETTESALIATRKYVGETSPPPPKQQKAAFEQLIAELEPELANLRSELEQTRREIILGRDQAGASDAEHRNQLRARLHEVIEAEHAAAARILSRQSGGGIRADRIAGLMSQAARVGQRLDEVIRTIDAVVDEALVEVKGTIQRERAELGAYRREFLTAEAESRALGGSVLGQSFREVKAKFYDVLIRTDVGVVDVSWSEKEDTDEDLRRHTLDKQREIKQLRDEFRDLLEEPAGSPGGKP